MRYSNLLFRRQFLLSSKTIEKLAHWQRITFGEQNLYAHPDVTLSTATSHDKSIEIAAVGDLIDHTQPDATNTALLESLVSGESSIEKIVRYLYGISGRYALFIKFKNNVYVINDCCALRKVYYTRINNEVHIASQPLLLKLALGFVEGKKYNDFHNSRYRAKALEYWIPCGSTLYENVYQLVANHYLDCTTLVQHRFYPVLPLVKKNLDDGINESALLLKQIMYAAHKRLKLALPLTCGLDSRTILSACRDFADELFIYTLQYRNLTTQSDDIRIAKNLTRSLGYTHHVIDCRKEIDPDFAAIYMQNSDTPHLVDWGHIAYGMFADYPADRVTLKGNCSEIAQCCIHYLYGWSPDLTTDDIISIMEWNTIPFIKPWIDHWKDSAIKTIHPSYKMLDMFFWEINMGGWQAQSQLEWDITQEAFTPFANRKLLDIMLGVDERFRARRRSDHELYHGIITTNWPELMREPINPSLQKLKALE